MSWRDDAACAGDPTPDLWYPNTNDPRSPRWDAPREICDACPVRLHCLADALQTGDDEGMRGGLTPHERAALGHTGPGRKPQPIPHGTRRGYQAHYRRGQTPCRLCREAWEDTRRKDPA